MNSQRLSDSDRRLHSLAGYGTIAEVDHLSLMVRVDVGERRTDWLPTAAVIGHNFRAWFPPRVGSQVMLVCPSGDPANGTIAQTLYSAALPPPETGGDIDVIAWDDGTTVRYDSARQVLTISTPGEVNIQCDGDMRLKAGGTLFVDAAAVRVFEGG